jgi:glucokinase
MRSNDSRAAAAVSSDGRGGRDALVGVDIGGTKTAICVSLEAPQVLWRHEFATRPEDGPEHALRSIVAAIHRGLAETNCTATAIGVSCGGPLDRRAGVIQAPPNLSTWLDVRITDLLTAEIGVPCALENDANAGALAEHRFGAGRGIEDMIFLTLGTGVGAGLILQNQLFRGASNMAGEIGHVRLTEHGPIGHGKIGSVEGWVSGGGMARLGVQIIQDALAKGEETTLARKLDGLTARDIAAELRNGDAIARKIVAISGSRLGEALAVLVDLLNPGRIVMGGLALRLGEELMSAARSTLQKEALADSASMCEIVPAQLGERIGDVAALCVATEVAVPKQQTSIRWNR